MLCVCVGVHGTKARQLHFVEELGLGAAICVQSKIIYAHCIRSSYHVRNNHFIVHYTSALKYIFLIFREDINPVCFIWLL